MRLFLLNIFWFLPDKIMLKIQYCIKTGRSLNLKNPKRFSEKLQFYKISYKNKLMAKCCDKYEVREFVGKCGLTNILNECYGVFSNYYDIEFDKLPKEFVLKDTLGSGGNSIIICRDKENLNANLIKIQINNWLNTKNIRSGGREWPYYSGKRHRVIIEKIIKNDDKDYLIDYKFLCFNGKFEYLYIIPERKLGQRVPFGIFNKKFDRLPVNKIDEMPFCKKIEKPKDFKLMIEIAEKLSSPFPHARIDLYNTGKKIVFGEITFYDDSGYFRFEPDSFDNEIGNKFSLDF